MIIQRTIVMGGKTQILACDARCDKAWGIQYRPHVDLTDNVDDIAYLADGELGTAPVRSGIYEGGEEKPRTNEQRLNKWCARQCERGRILAPTDAVVVPSYAERVYNIRRRRDTNPELVISGGQTGVDRAGLDAALERRRAIGGWCPRGRRAEDGQVPKKYPLKETGERDYRVRTQRNVDMALATLILSSLPLTSGSLQTQAYAEKRAKERFGNTQSVLTCDPRTADPVQIAAWVQDYAALNVAGPRESKMPGIYEAAKAFLLEVFR